MSLLSQMAARRLGLRPRHGVRTRKGLRVRTPDGIELATNVYAPRGRERGPTVMVRSPYGRSAFALSTAIPLATQGYHVVLQACRGTDGSGGTFDPHHDERADGLATIDWIKQQAWFDGSIVTYGLSYLGYTQWAIASDAGPEVKAMAMQVTLSDFSQMTYAGDSLNLELAAGWTQMVTRMKSLRGKLELGLGMALRREPISAEQWRTLPLETIDEVTTRQRVPFWRDWMEHCSADDPWWQPMNFHRSISQVRRPISLVSGWHDIFTPWTLRDFAELQRCGAPARLTVGPWSHLGLTSSGVAIDEALDWFSHQLGERPSARTRPVKLFVMGADAWRSFDQWPPKECASTAWYLQPGAALHRRPAADSPPDRYVYHPADPTPSLGGPRLMGGTFAVDNRPLESRSDVLCFTSEPLAADLDVVGVPTAEIHVSSSAVSADIFVRLCDVDDQGTSRNVCDGLRRVAIPADGSPVPVHVDLWPTAYRFRRGHRLRVQVSSGAFPRFARNLGTGEPLATGTTLQAAEQSIHHGPDCPSALRLPVCAAEAP